jgi:hypothetical protein
MTLRKAKVWTVHVPVYAQVLYLTAVAKRKSIRSMMTKERLPWMIYRFYLLRWISLRKMLLKIKLVKSSMRMMNKNFYYQYHRRPKKAYLGTTPLAKAPVLVMGRLNQMMETKYYIEKILIFCCKILETSSRL